MAADEFERPEPAPYDELSEDDVMALQAENERLREALTTALADLDGCQHCDGEPF